MSRQGLVSSTSSSFLNSERALNDLLDLIRRTSLIGTTSNRRVTLTNATAIEITASNNVRSMHIFNDTGVNVRYGGSSVSSSQGGMIYPGGTLPLNVNSNSSIYLRQDSGGNVDIDIVEFT